MPLGSVIAAVLISGVSPASDIPNSLAPASPLPAGYLGAKMLSSGASDLYSLRLQRRIDDDPAMPVEKDSSTIPASSSSIAGPVALAAIGLLAIGGGLVTVSRRLPQDKKDERFDGKE